MVSGVSGGASRADLAQQMQAMREAMFQKADTDGSWGLILSEFGSANPSTGTTGSAASAADTAWTLIAAIQNALGQQSATTAATA